MTLYSGQLQTCSIITSMTYTHYCRQRFELSHEVISIYTSCYIIRSEHKARTIGELSRQYYKYHILSPCSHLHHYTVQNMKLISVRYRQHKAKSIEVSVLRIVTHVP